MGVRVSGPRLRKSVTLSIVSKWVPCFQREATPEYTSAYMSKWTNGEKRNWYIRFDLLYSTNAAFRLHPSLIEMTTLKTFQKGFLPCRWNARDRTLTSFSITQRRGFTIVTNDSRNKSGCDWFGCITDPKACSNSHSKAADSWYLPFVVFFFKPGL